jgi:hypothetical protein
MKRKFCCDSSRQLYENYYVNQSGHGITVFQGSRGQRGHGIGSTLVGLFRSAVPMLKRGLAAFGKQALSTGLQVAGDMADGQSFSESAKLRARQGIKRLAEDGVSYLQNESQTGSGFKRRRITQQRRVKSGRRKRQNKRKVHSGRKRKRNRKTKRIKHSDIFD